MGKQIYSITIPTINRNPRDKSTYNKIRTAYSSEHTEIPNIFFKPHDRH